MRSLREVLASARIENKSLASFSGKFQRNSIQHAIAEYLLRDLHKRHAGNFGYMGAISGGVEPSTDSAYTMNTQLAVGILADIGSAPTATITSHFTNVTISGLRCFSAQDVETDELHAIASLISVHPKANQLVKTIRLPRVNVHSRQTVYENFNLGDVQVVGSGIMVHISLWDHESGDVDDIQKQVQAVLEEMVKQAQKAIVTAIAADDPSVTAGTVGSVTDWDIAGFKPIKIATLGLATLIAEGLADDLLGEVSYFVPTENLINFVAGTDSYNNSLRTNEFLAFDAKCNWPPLEAQVKAFDRKPPGLYKAWLRLRTDKVEVISEPEL